MSWPVVEVAMTKSQIGQNPERTTSRVGQNPDLDKIPIGQNPESNQFQR